MILFLFIYNFPSSGFAAPSIEDKQEPPKEQVFLEYEEIRTGNVNESWIVRDSFGQVGLSANVAKHPLVRYNQFLSQAGLPRLWIYLGTTGKIFKFHPPPHRSIY